MLNVFNERNPSFSGDVAVMGHSLGSCILFDLLYHQVIYNIIYSIIHSIIDNI